MKVKLLKDKHYPAAWVFRFKPLVEASIVDAVPAHNIPEPNCLWVDTEELKNDPYGILLYPGDYEIIE